MTRGKHGQRAENRERAQNDALAPYQRKVAALTAENKELRAKLRDYQRAQQAVIRRLRAERDEGIAPALTVAQQENLALRENRDILLGKYTHLRRLHTGWQKKMYDHFVATHGLTVDEALAASLSLGQNALSLIDFDEMAKRGISSEAIERVQRAKGNVDLKKVSRALGWEASPPRVESGHSSAWQMSELDDGL